MRTSIFIVALSLLAAGTSARADTITDLINFSATDSQGTTVTGSYTLTFDPTLDYNTSAGLTVNSFSAPFPSGATTLSEYIPSLGKLIIGGGPYIAVPDFIGDYELVISGFPSEPEFAGLLIATDNYGGTDMFSSGSVTSTAVTPEPASLLLFGTGLLGVVPIVRRKYCRA